VRGWIRGFIKIDDTIFEVFFKRTVKWGRSFCNWCKVVGANIQLVIVLIVNFKKVGLP